MIRLRDFLPWVPKRRISQGWRCMRWVSARLICGLGTY
jgi:hypothetical protein